MVTGSRSTTKLITDPIKMKSVGSSEEIFCSLSSRGWHIRLEENLYMQRSHEVNEVTELGR